MLLCAAVYCDMPWYAMVYCGVLDTAADISVSAQLLENVFYALKEMVICFVMYMSLFQKYEMKSVNYFIIGISGTGSGEFNDNINIPMKLELFEVKFRIIMFITNEPTDAISKTRLPLLWVIL